MRAARPERLVRDLLATPVATLQVIVDQDGVLRMADFDEDSPRVERLLRRYYPGVAVEAGAAPKALRADLAAYFEGEMAALSRAPYRLPGTDFQRMVWNALIGIPAGTTTTYGALATAIGNPAAVRAVGLANGANPIGVVVPCHRVIGADGSLTGYGGGLPRKAWLLEHERLARR